MPTLPVTPLDEFFLNLDLRALMSVQFEVRVEGRLDAERLAAALRTATAQHPLARARLVGDRMHLRSLRWEIHDTADHLALELTDEPLATVRARLQSVLPDLDHSPGLLATLVHDDDGDVLLLNLHHGAFDGMSAVRLVTSIARAYAGEDDPVGGPDLARARDLAAIAGARGVRDVATRAGQILQDAVGRGNLTRVAEAGGGSAQTHYVFSTHRLTQEQTSAALGRRPDGCTVNDLVIAAHMMAICEWNRQHGAPVGSAVSVMMPVNLRPAEWSTEVLSNFASYLAVVVATSDVGELPAATSAVHGRTRPMKENGVAGWIVDVLRQTDLLPRFVRKNLQALLPLVDRQFVETTVLSNLGRVSLPAFGDAGEVTEVWFSPPNFGQIMPIALGVAGLNGELQLCLRGASEQIGADELAEFGALLIGILTGD